MLHDFFHCCPLMLNEQANRIRCFGVPTQKAPAYSSIRDLERDVVSFFFASKGERMVGLASVL